jgi:hypothetical protein
VAIIAYLQRLGRGPQFDPAAAQTAGEEESAGTESDVSMATGSDPARPAVDPTGEEAADVR